jgi:erythromycin esterase-like protein
MDQKGIINTILSISSTLKHEDDLDLLMEQIGDAKYVLLGEASHGTHEYYTWRTRISQRLIKEKGFSFIAVEGDWPDCYRINRYIKNYPDSGEHASDVLHTFERWPTWMWANWETAALAEWLKKHNTSLSDDKKIGFYGLDVYSLRESLEAIVSYLKENDQDTLQAALNAMRCFEPYKDEGQSYARASAFIPELCEKEVIQMLVKIRENIPFYSSDPENAFSTEQNALVIHNAEKYYRAMIRSGADSWNIRDRHMVETLNRLMDFHGPSGKAIVWEHNTHIGDARATDMAKDGMVNLGQLVRQEHWEEGVFSVGFGSYKGSVIAGRQWGDVMRRINVPEALNESWEDLLHKAGNGNDLLLLLNNLKSKEDLNTIFGHRAIGVVYQPEYEKFGNYVPSILPERYDAFIYIDQTKALHPLHITPDGHKVPETYPFGF